MAFIEARDVSVEYKIYSAQSRSFRSQLLRTVGGGIEEGRHSHAIVRALSGVNLSLRAGDRVALLGGNGAGKSTLLKVCAGILEPTVGSVNVAGRVSTLLDMSMGMDTEATGYENIIMRAVFLGATFAEARAKIPAIEEFSELGDYLRFPMRTYSTGMALRLSFAIATSIQPEILILDEMIGTGDASFAAKARARTAEMIGNLEILVLATHDLRTAQNLCNRALVLDHGRIAADLPIEQGIEFYSTPQHLV